ncbi:MAG: hypothetical protein K8S54_05805 [Spirochaetia bacterium]|nr:hypothetical protein [Spirochaetia bacterium]
MNKTLVTAALSGLMLAASCATADSPKMAEGKCYGINSCKGQTDCGGKDHSCSGKNSCKGQGWKHMSKKDCEAKNGKFEA